MKRFFALVPALAALALEISPWGAVLRFANPEGEPFRRTYSYFSLTPFGYGNVFCLMTAVLTALLVIALVFALLPKGKDLVKSAFFLSVSSAVLSLCPLFFGWKSYSLVGLGITLCLALTALLLLQKEK